MGARTVSKPPEERSGLKRPGIVVATFAEARTLGRRRAGAEEPGSGCDGWLIEVSGIGPDRARTAAERLLKSGATALVSWGTAAGLVPGLSPGTLIIPRTIIAETNAVYSTDGVWQDRLESRLKGSIDVHPGPLAESLTILQKYEDKTALSRRTGAVAADMESAAVADVACKADLPFLSVRAVADPVEFAIPPWISRAVDASGRMRPWKCFAGSMLRPVGLLSLIRLVRIFLAARAALSIVAPLMGNGHEDVDHRCHWICRFSGTSPASSGRPEHSRPGPSGKRPA